MDRRTLKLAHGWRMSYPATAAGLARNWIRPAVRAVPTAITTLLPPCLIRLDDRIETADAASRWTLSEEALEIAIATADIEPHDVAMELLVCVGQALWDTVGDERSAAWLALLRTETEERLTGEIDEDALAEKRRLFSGAGPARGCRRLAAYASASFAGTVAEYVHSLWHDVTIRTGSDYLPADALRRRMELLEKWFQPGRGYRLFPRSPKNSGTKSSEQA